MPLIEKSREIRRQIFWSQRHGEWVVPSPGWLRQLPLRLRAALLRAYLSCPWVDMGTSVFSHAEDGGGQEEELFRGTQQIECVGQLHHKYGVVINGTTYRDQTWLTFTYDPALLTETDARCLAAMYEEQIAVARRELKCAG